VLLCIFTDTVEASRSGLSRDPSPPAPPPGRIYEGLAIPVYAMLGGVMPFRLHSSFIG